MESWDQKLTESRRSKKKTKKRGLIIQAPPILLITLVQSVTAYLLLFSMLFRNLIPEARRHIYYFWRTSTSSYAYRALDLFKSLLSQRLLPAVCRLPKHNLALHLYVLLLNSVETSKLLIYHSKATQWLGRLRLGPANLATLTAVLVTMVSAKNLHVGTMIGDTWTCSASVDMKSPLPATPVDALSKNNCVVYV